MDSPTNPTDAVNYSEGTKTVLITVKSPVGIHKTKNNAFKVYPNPTSDRIILDGLTERAILMVSDLNGRVFMNEEIENKQSVSISSLPNGTYLVNILIKGKSEAKVFMKK